MSDGKKEFTDEDCRQIQRLSDAMMAHMDGHSGAVIITSLALTCATFLATCTIGPGHSREEGVALFAKQIGDMLPDLIAAEAQRKLTQDTAAADAINNRSLP